MSSSTNFPLRWESTGDQWWFASPIDWATANGHYDLVRELLRLDGNHLIKLTSLRRIRRLETVWDDESQFDEVAKCRSQVARKLLVECENKKGKDSLIRGGCGGWLLYTAASAGDLSFVQELLQRDPLLVFGEGEYGVTDMLYAAARSKNSDVFRLVFEYALSPRFSSGNGEEVEEHVGDVPLTYKVDIMNRALHAAARGGNLGVLKEILAGSSDHVLAYRDIQGATILHAAAGRGQVEVVKYLITCYSDIIISSTDNHGNTALHVAATRGQLAVVEALTDASPSLVYSMNNAGDTFLHVAVTGFQTHCFRRLDRQIELMKELVSGKMCNIEQIVNAKNKDGRTVLHVAIVSNIHSELVELLLMTVGSVDVNIRDKDGMTPLDILRQHPRSESSDIITRKLISAGGMFSHKENENDAAAAEARRVVASHLRMEGSPGTCFRISDPEVLMFTGIEKVGPRNMNKPAANHATQVLKRILQWPRMKKRDTRKLKKTTAGGQSCVDVSPIPLRQRFAKPCSGRSTQHLLPSPTAKKRFGSGLIPNLRAPRRGRSSCSNSPLKSCSGDPPEGCVNRKSSVNQYFCFGAAGGGAGLHPFEIYERSVLSTA